MKTKKLTPKKVLEALKKDLSSYISFVQERQKISNVEYYQGAYDAYARIKYDIKLLEEGWL